MNHYVYKITDPQTGQYYIGVRSCNCSPEDDEYMGSFYTWKPDHHDRLEKEILKSDFETREEANEYENILIKENINDELNENYYIPKEGFSMYGSKHTEETKLKISNNGVKGKNWEEIHGKKKSLIMKKKLQGKSHPMYGKTHSKETRELYSKNRKGEKNPMYGKKHSEETKVEISKKNSLWHKNNDHPMKGTDRFDVVKRNKKELSKKVLDINNNDKYNSITEASNNTKYAISTISAHCNGKFKKQKFKFVN